MNTSTQHAAKAEREKLITAELERLELVKDMQARMFARLVEIEAELTAAS